MTDLRSMFSLVTSEDIIRRALRDLENPPGPFLGPEARRRAARGPGRTLAIAAGLALAASVFAIAMPPPAELVERGAGTDPAIDLSLLVEGREGDAQRLVGGRVEPGHAIIFRVRTRDAGFVCIQEERPSGWATILPSAGETVEVAPGEQLLASQGRVQAFRTDLGPGVRAYRARFHSASGPCESASADAHVEVEWVD